MTTIKFVDSACTDIGKYCAIQKARMWMLGNGGKCWGNGAAGWRRWRTHGEVKRLWLWSLVYGAHLIINPVQHTHPGVTLRGKQTWLCLCTAQQNGDNSSPPASHTTYYTAHSSYLLTLRCGNTLVKGVIMYMDILKRKD